ncbi:MAG: DsbC family protein [Desulfobulbaceae bacterium]|jgi:thiol:disulfide interchange protein DsbC|nr:DsbC family protein [Desulfobulbaceae bacterium]
MIKIHSLLFISIFISSPALAMPQGGCGAGDCRDCHTLSKKEAATLLQGKVSEVVDVNRSQVPGLWEVEAILKGRKVPLYIDFSKQYLLSGNIVRLTSGENLTQQSFSKMNRVDISRIPLEDAIIVGNPAAPRKIIVFDDPECTYCRKLHPEMAEVVAKHEDIAFYIKMFPLAMHLEAYDKARTIICAKVQGSNEQASALLADSLAGKSLPAPVCDSDQVDQNIALAKELFISSTPTLIMPDGRVLPGYKVAEKIVAALKPGKP